MYTTRSRHLRTILIVLSSVLLILTFGQSMVDATAPPAPIAPPPLPGTLLYDQFGVTLALTSTLNASAGYQGDDGPGDVGGYSFDWDSFKPTKNLDSVDWTEGDWFGRWNTDYSYVTIDHPPADGVDRDYYPSGGEVYDVEAFYFDNDKDNYYLVIVSSIPHQITGTVGGSEVLDVGVVDPNVGAFIADIRSGDIAINFFDGGERAERFGTTWGYDYGIDLTHDDRDNVTAVSGGNVVNLHDKEIGTELYKTSADAGGSSIVSESGSDWYTSSESFHTVAYWEHTNFDPFSADAGLDPVDDFLGNVTTNYYEYEFPGGLEENDAPTYIYEFTIPRSLFGAGDLEHGDGIGFGFGPGCRNDGHGDAEVGDPQMRISAIVDDLEVGDLIWQDDNDNGIYEPLLGEAGINGVEVQLFNENDDPLVETPVMTTTTAALNGESGRYVFTTLPEGAYFVHIPAAEFQAGGALTAMRSSIITELDPDDDENADGSGTAGTGAVAGSISGPGDENGLNDIEREANGISTGTFTLTTTTEPTGEDSATIQITALDTDSNLTVDFGFVPVALPAAVGNYVWIDENADGLQDAGERGIGNVEVILYNASCVEQARTTTDAHGGYLFAGLDAGTYRVDINGAQSVLTGMSQTTNPILTSADFGNQNLAATTCGYELSVAAGAENLTADFGYIWANPNGNTGNAALGDRVWLDTDGDGQQDPNELGIEGVCLELFSVGGDGIFDAGSDGRYDTGDDDEISSGTQTTDFLGNYLFDGLAPAGYVVQVCASSLAPSGVLDGYDQTGDPDDFGQPATAPDNLSTNPVILAPGDVFLNVDFGYQPDTVAVGSIGDTVWFDANANGSATIDSGELGIAGVTVALIKDIDGDGVWDSGEPIIATDVTDAAGEYLFAGLPLGCDGDGDSADSDYIIWVNDTNNVLQELRQTYDQDGPLDNLSATALTVGSPNDFDQDFSYTDRNQAVGLGLIGDTVWFDADNSGGAAQGSEPGIEGVVLELTTPAGIVMTTTTNENGNYWFGGLALDATYTVTVSAENFIAGGGLEGLSNTYEPATGGINQSVVDMSVTGPIDLDQDFSYSAPAGGKLGNLVFLDVDADGVYESAESETMLSGVTIDLYRDLNGNGLVDAGEPRFASTTTSGTDGTFSGDDGNYAFCYLPLIGNGDGDAASEWVVNVTDEQGVLNGYWHSSGTANTTDNSQIDPDAVEIDSTNTENWTADFGYYVDPANVGNWVWLDVDADGSQNDGQTGINAVEVQLVIAYPDSTRITVTTVTADDSNTNAGWYSFNNLLLDEDYNGDNSGSEPSYTISVNSAQAVLSSYAPTAVDSSNGTDLTDSDNHSGTAAHPIQGALDTSRANDASIIASFDFGYTVGSAALGNYIWLDEDGDGQQDASERGLANVIVAMTDASGTTVTTTTDANGGYLFSGLPAGTFTVTVDVLQAALSNLSYTQAAMVGEDLGNQDPAGYAISLEVGEVNLSADFGFNYGSSTANAGVAALGDTVWADIDGDGVQDPNEIGISGITLTATTADGTVYTTTTDAQGHYIFPALPAGAYIVEVLNPPAGWTATGDPDHYATTGTSNNITNDPIILAPGDFVQIVDFGYQPPAGTYDNAIGDTVWFDTNRDGVQGASSNEPGIAGVTLSLLNADGDVIATAMTDEDGMYLFSNLPDGTYSVVVNDTYGVLAALTQSGDPDVTLDGRSTTSVSGGMTDLDQDFGYAPITPAPNQGLIGDFIWLDQNGDGNQDAGEMGLANVVVTLALPDGAVITTTTNDQGMYIFPNLPVDGDGETYTVTVITTTLPAQVISTYDPDNAGDPFVSIVTIDSADPINLEQDFGVNGVNSLSGTIWQDIDADGTLTTTETTYFADVTILLVDSDGTTIATTATDASGDYSFVGLPDGEYTIVVEDAANVLGGFWHSNGANDGADNNSQTDPYVINLDNENATTDPVANPTADFGYYVNAASIGNYVWLDSNADGIQNDGQTGINDVTVTLVIAYPDSTSITVTTVTTDDINNNAGWYSFNNLLLDESYNGTGAGSEPSYTISVETVQAALSGLVPTLVDDSDATEATDSDAHSGVSAQPVQGQTGVARGDDGEAIASYDFGFTLAMFSIGNFVWQDGDTTPNGVYSSTVDTPITNVIVQLWDGVPNGSGSTMITATATVAGAYSFDNLEAGDYYVHIPSSEFAPGRPLNGAGIPFGVSPNGGNDTGDDSSGHNGVSGNDVTGVSSGMISLGGTEPTGEPTHGLPNPDDERANWTVDFAFFLAEEATAVGLATQFTQTVSPAIWVALLIAALAVASYVAVQKQQGKRMS